MYILGINCFGHDSSAALLSLNGTIIAAAEEERFSREKHDSSLPVYSIRYCLEKAGIGADQIEYVSYYWNPYHEPRKILTHFLKNFPKSLNLLKGVALHTPFISRFPSMLNLKRELRNHLKISKKLKVAYIDHHMAHAGGAFFLSPFEKAAILTVDGIGEWATTTLSVGNGNQIQKIQEISFPHSLGFFYSAITNYLGFQSNSDEWKVMALASYGDPLYHDVFSEMCLLKNDGSFELNLDYFSFHTHGAKKWLSEKFTRRFGPPRRKQDEISSHHKNIAASLQKRFEEAIIHLTNNLYKKTQLDSLAFAGGSALNCVANGKIYYKTPFKKIFIHPSPADSGTSIGAALFLYHHLLGKARNPGILNSNFGPSFSNSFVETVLKQNNIKYFTPSNIFCETAKLIEKGLIGGWFQDSMEFGPRALGQRSIIADPRKKELKSKINLKVKFRENFRPLAPSILEENQSEYFDLPIPSPFMSFASHVNSKKIDFIPATVHVDGSARYQTVSKTGHPRFWELINEFKNLTGIPVILDTSFNIQGEPIVCTPYDALKCFKNASLDFLVMGDFLLLKEAS